MQSASIMGFGVMALTLTGSPALSTQHVAPTYLLKMEIHDGDRVVGAPKLKIAAGEPSTVEIEEAGGNYYAVTMTATAQPGTTVFIKSKIDVTSGGVHQAFSPSMLVNLNESSAFAFSASASAKPVRVDFSLNKIV